MDPLATRLPWYFAGPLLGLCVVALLAIANRPLGASGGWIDLVAFLRKPSDGLKWTVFLVIGIVIGGVLSLATTGGFDPNTFAGFDARWGTTFWTRGVLLFAAASVMGYGVRTSGGCTSGHGICGTSLGSPASWVSTAVFMATAIAAANALAWLKGMP